MKSSEFKRWLAEQGVTFGGVRGSHQKIYLNEKMSILPLHKSKEIGIGLVQKIKKDLGLK